MSRYLKVPLVLMACALLFGCGATKPVVIEKTTTTVLSPPKSLRMKETVPKPDFSPEQYSLLTADQKEDTLIGLNQKLYRALIRTNDRLAAIDEWVEQHEKLYEKDQTP